MSVFIQVNQRNGSRKRMTVGSSHLNEVAPSDKITTLNKSQQGRKHHKNGQYPKPPTKCYFPRCRMFNRYES